MKSAVRFWRTTAGSASTSQPMPRLWPLQRRPPHAEADRLSMLAAADRGGLRLSDGGEGCCPSPGRPSQWRDRSAYARVVRLKRWITAAAVVGAGIPAWLFIVSPFTLAVMESAVPGTADLRLPTGATIVATERDCGSGGCWIDVEVRAARGMSEASLMEALGLDHDRYACERGGPPMFWTICHWRSDAVADLGRMVISLAYQRAQ